MAIPVRRMIPTPQVQALVRRFRSDSALEALASASAAQTPNLVLYKYPSLSGSISALFARLYHSRLSLPCLILPFSSFIPFTVADVSTLGLHTCFLLDFVGPPGFALQLSNQHSCQVISFDHRKSALTQIPTKEEIHGNLEFHIDPEKLSAVSVYEYFSEKLSEYEQNEDNAALLDASCQHRMETLLDYIGDKELCKGAKPDIEAFNVGIKECCPNLNCIINRHMYQQLTEINVVEVIAKGNAYLSARRKAAFELLDKVGKVFKLRLGRGLYGDCLGIRADENPDLTPELGEELCRKSAEAGLRPIGAVIYMKRKNLKMCLRSNDSSTDVSKIAKAYGGGGNRNFSSFMIRMDEYNQWRRAT